MPDLAVDARRLEVLLAGPNTHPPHYLTTGQLHAVTALRPERIREALRTLPHVEETEHGWIRTA